MLKAILKQFIERFRKNEGGQIAIIFAISATVLVTAVGAGLDLSRAYVARQELSNAATLTCQYSARPAVVSTAYNGGSGVSNYISNVDAYAAKFITSQNFPFTQTNSAPFSYSQGGASSINFTAVVPTLFIGIIGISSVPISTTVNCAAGVAQVNDTNPAVVLSESFESAPCTGTCWGDYLPSGQVDVFQASATNTFPAVTAYSGQTSTQWTVMGYCLEVDAVGVIENSVPDGAHSAELDCDNGGGSSDKGNSSISNKSYYTAGTYELRYNYVARVDYPNYDPTYICGSTATDVAWANDTNSSSGTKLRTNQINVYFDPDNNGSPGTHTTIDGTQQLAGVDLIDECVYSQNWIQRSVKITVSTAGYYWLSFAADGANDSTGGQLDNIMLCHTSCSGSVQNNFPSAWTSSPLLFEDTFESPVYTADYSNWINKSGNLNNSTGTTGTSSSGWPNATATGWATAPFNQVNYILQGADQGSQYISMDGYNSNGNTLRNRTVSRSFDLDPGYYQITYDYISDVDLSPGGYVGSLCYNAPSSGFIVNPPSSYPTSSGNIRFYQSTTTGLLTNLVGLFMANGQLISTPIGGGAVNSATSYNNPDGSVSTTPAVAPDTINYANYNSNQVNPLIDWCNYTSNFNWLTRTVYVKITKPGQYWITFSANGGDADGNGGGVDDVKLKALNSLYGSAPSSYVTIPTPSAAPGSIINYSGFSIIADPLTP